MSDTQGAPTVKKTASTKKAATDTTQPDSATNTGAVKSTDAANGGTPTATPEAAMPESFPAEMNLVNETAMPYVVARKYVAPGETVPVTVKDESHLTRIWTDIKHLLGLQDHYKDRDVKPLRVEQAS